MTVEVRYTDGSKPRTEQFQDADQVSESLDGFCKVEEVTKTRSGETIDTLRIFNKDRIIWINIE
jgi:hypothetical protein